MDLSKGSFKRPEAVDKSFAEKLGMIICLITTSTLLASIQYTAGKKTWFS